MNVFKHAHKNIGWKIILFQKVQKLENPNGIILFDKTEINT